MESHCSIIIVNWNGWLDTIECLETVLKQDYLNYDVILVDNNSSDGSVEKIKYWAKHSDVDIKTRYEKLIYPLVKRPISIIEINHFNDNNISNYFKIGLIKDQTIIYLIKNSENLGFAKANNIAIKFARRFLKSEYVFLLNNDTVIEPNALRKLVDVALKRPEFAALQSAIYYYDVPEKIWRVGGSILPWAKIKYFKKLNKKNVIPTTFLTGCALFIPILIIEEVGLISEKFFHGEEDFEFSLRLKNQKRKAAVVVESKVYHKIAISAKKQWKSGSEIILNSALNRILNMRNYFSPIKWRFWRFFTIIYYFYLMIFLYRMSLIFSFKLSLEIFRQTKHIKNVTKNTINSILKKIS